MAKGSFVVLIATGFGLGLNYLYSILLARFLGANDYGLYALGLAAFNLLSTFALGGLDSAALKFVPASFVKTDRSRVSSTIKTLFWISLVFGVFSGLCLLLGSTLIADRAFHTPQASNVIIIFALGIPAFTTSSALIATLQALNDITWRVTVKYLCEPIAKIAITVLLLWIGLSVQGATVAFVAALYLTAYLCVLPLREHLFWEASKSSDRISYGEILRFSTPLLWASLFASLAVRSDILLLGYWMSTGEVGIYSATFLTSSIIALVPGSLESIANPLLSISIAKCDHVQLKKLYKTVMRWSLSLALPLFLILCLFPQDILSIFGEQFKAGAACLLILAIGQIINALSSSSNSVLLLTGHSKLIMWNTFGIGILQIGLNLFLIPRFGLIGAAISTSAGLILINLARVMECFFISKVQPYEWIIWKPFAAGVGAVLSVEIVKIMTHDFHISLLITMLFSTYLTFLILLGLEKDDRTIAAEITQKIKSR